MTGLAINEEMGGNEMDNIIYTYNIYCFYDFTILCGEVIFSDFMHGRGQLSASLVSLLIFILVVFVCIFHFCITCFVAEIKLSYLIFSYL